MENRIAVVSIIVEKDESIGRVNEILHEYRQYIIGRMGIPYREKQVSVISVVLDGPQQETSALSGKLGMIDGVKAKTLTTKK